MIAIGLDVGTGFVKCVSDIKRDRFPSIYAYRLPHPWEKDQKMTEGVGEAAVKMMRDPDTISIKPVVHGRPVNEEAFGRLVREAVVRCTGLHDALADRKDRLAFVIGLPFEARSSCAVIQKMISKFFKQAVCDVVPQALGTLVDAGLEDGIIVSIGQGTTEIVSFVGRKAVWGQSHHQAVGYISSKIGGEYSYLESEIFLSKETPRLVSALADSILNRAQAARQQFPGLAVLVSGGGILIPGMREALEARLEFKVPENPVMSNALGLHRIASSYSAC